VNRGKSAISECATVLPTEGLRHKSREYVTMKMLRRMLAGLCGVTTAVLFLSQSVLGADVKGADAKALDDLRLPPVPKKE